MDVQWIETGGGVSLPCLVTQKGPRYVATLLDWRLARDGENACDALQALTRAVNERLLRAFAALRQHERVDA